MLEIKNWGIKVSCIKQSIDGFLGGWKPDNNPWEAKEINDA